MIPSVSDATGVLSKMTVPRSGEDAERAARDRRCDVSHHAPTAEPTTVARMPNVRLVTDPPDSSGATRMPLAHPIEVGRTVGRVERGNLDQLSFALQL